MALAQALVAGGAVAASPRGLGSVLSSRIESSKSRCPSLGVRSRKSSSSVAGGLAFKTGRAAGAASPSFHGVVREQVGRGKSGVVCAAGDVSADSTTFLILGAVLIAVVGTAFPFIFSRKDTCPECGGAGFVRGQNSGALRANAARKDQQQIVCSTCKGLGKIGQIDKA